jgi:protein TonB
MKNIFIVFITLFSFCLYAQEQSGLNNPSDEVYNMGGLDVQPSFPGLIQQEFIKQFKQPEIDKDIDVRLYISFVIEKDGRMSNILCNRDPGFGIGTAAENALRAVKTRWNPGINNGTPVRVKYSLPIRLVIKSDPTPPKKD